MLTKSGGRELERDEGLYPVLIAMLLGVEASYLAAWSAFAPAGPYAEFLARWSSADFAA